MGEQVNIADVLQNRQSWRAFDIWMGKVFEKMPYESMLIYFVDHATEDVLLQLAAEFNVEGLRGWDFTGDLYEKQLLIKTAIQLHKYKGTAWAVERAVEQAGYTDFTHIERAGTDPVTGWAIFRIVVPISYIPDGVLASRAVKLINLYKRQSAVFYGIEYSGLAIDGEDEWVTADDETNIGPGIDVDDSLTTVSAFRYNGAFKYDGSRNYNQDSDVISFTLV